MDSDNNDEERPPHPTSYSFDANTLRRRHAQVREEISSPASPTPPISSSPRLNSPSPSMVDPEAEDEGELFACNICLETASNPIVTLCGHLFCWPCLHQWMSTRSAQANACPVCKASIDKDKLVPIYAKGRECKDPREQAVPQRPTAQRPATAPARHRLAGWDSSFFPAGAMPVGGTGVTVGFGLFPSLFGVHYTLGGAVPMPTGETPYRQADALAQQQAFLSRVFMMMGILIMIAILLY
ncbi:hypothetical protein HDU85_007814 [Gaertneriomyces sp. JEL0708]|nr:hypothetical protein HDU85_007814 [Gaertneriomyces sp. JEL0708]